MEENKIELYDVSYSIKNKLILDRINLCIPKGARVAICGPNGAGKSTLFNVMLNIPGVDFKKKTHKLLGKINNTLFDIKNYSNVKVHLQNSKIGYSTLLEVGELLRLCFQDELPKEMLEKLGLKGKLKQRISSLSGGEFQKLNILLVVATNPKVIFLDEMTTGLDYEARKQILDYLRDYITRSRATLIFITHYLEEIYDLAEEIYFMDKGKIKEYGKLAELFVKYNITNQNVNRLYEEVMSDE